MWLWREAWDVKKYGHSEQEKNWVWEDWDVASEGGRESTCACEAEIVCCDLPFLRSLNLSLSPVLSLFSHTISLCSCCHNVFPSIPLLSLSFSITHSVSHHTLYLFLICLIPNFNSPLRKHILSYNVKNEICKNYNAFLLECFLSEWPASKLS